MSNTIDETVTAPLDVSGPNTMSNKLDEMILGLPDK